MNKTQTRILLLSIIILFFVTRLYKINEIPPSVYWDEASIGVNAYSIAQTGKDEWGDFLPLHFRAFGEFKLPIYVYAVAIFVKIFGLNEFSVRAPAVLFSLGVIILTFFLAKRLTGNSAIGLWSSFFVSISPWFFIFSRTGYEATAGLIFYLLGIYLFFLHRKNPYFILISVISFILSAYSYNSFRIISPLTLLILIIFEIKNLTANIGKLIPVIMISAAILAASLFPIYRLYVYDTGNFRFNVVGIKSTTDFFTNYLSHFSPNFLLSGDKNLRSQQTGFGQIYFIDIFLIIFGILYILKSKSKYLRLFVIFLLIEPIPASLTKESPHALRSLSTVPFICMIASLGVIYMKKILKVKPLFLNCLIIIVAIIFFAKYFFSFLTTYPVQSSKDWQFGYKEIFTKYSSEFSNYKRIIISDEYAQPYIFALFYGQYDPERFRTTVIRNDVSQWGFSTVYKFDKFEFGKVKKLVDENTVETLIFASANEQIPNKFSDEIIKFLDGSIAFWVYRI